MGRGGRRGCSKRQNVPMSPDNTEVTQKEAIEQEDNTIKEVSNETVTAEIELARVSNPALEVTESPRRHIISTYAAIIDPDEGTRYFGGSGSCYKPSGCGRVRIPFAHTPTLLPIPLSQSLSPKSTAEEMVSLLLHNALFNIGRTPTGKGLAAY
ncbi:hypothetical protein Cgig2_030547 [Carnegiea gigantea]|uniref:Uncharacterized protein n=1 Tax=Carnegiea gigantea TaxID=171969 RepID=A0A9Q1JFL7_9CARY|nr:hypothetical protein Cgig2_030547 [Carnegiea gigantea]